MEFIFTKDFANNFKKDEIVSIEKHGTDYLVNRVALVDANLLLKFGRFMNCDEADDRTVQSLHNSQNLSIGQFLQNCDLSSADLNEILLSGIYKLFPEYHLNVSEVYNAKREGEGSDAATLYLIHILHDLGIATYVSREDACRIKIQKMFGELTDREWEEMRNSWKMFTGNPEYYENSAVAECVLQWLTEIRKN